jgi:tripartite-type tricarboxylate transporter receptor subunit TctC
MARRSSTPAAPTVDAEGNPIAPVARKQGPRTVYVVFKPDTDKEVIQAFQAALQEVSISRNAVFAAVQKASMDGKITPFVSYQVKAADGEE